MRYFAVIAALAFAVPSYAQTISHGIVETQNLTGTDPTAITQGTNLRGIAGYQIVLCAATGNTLSGAGTLQADYWDEAIAEWMPAPAFDYALSARNAGKRCAVFPNVAQAVSYGRIRFTPKGITVSGGTTVTIHYRSQSR